MKFKIILTDEQSEVLGQYSVDVVKKIDPKEFEKDELDGCLIEESDFEFPIAMGQHARYFGELIIDDVKAIFFQRKGV